MNPDNNRRAMAYFATIGVAEQEMKPTDEAEEQAKVEQGAK